MNPKLRNKLQKEHIFILCYNKFMIDIKPILILFGSRASGNINKNSDFDVAVFCGRSLNLDEKIYFILKASEVLNISEEKIDLIDAYSASPLLQFEIARKGKLIFGEKDDFNKFKFFAFKNYTSTARLRRQREKAILNLIK